MKKNDFHALLKKAIKKDFPAYAVSEISACISKFRRGRKNLAEAITSEQAALARWDMHDATEEWEQLSNLYDLQGFDITKL